MRMEPARQDRLAAPRDPPRHRDRLPAGGRAVVHRGVGDVAAVEPRDLGLELEQGLQRALGDFGLVGRVAGQELAALDEMVDAGRDVVAIGAAAEEEGHVAGRDVGAGPARRAGARPKARWHDRAGPRSCRRAAPPRARRRTDRRSRRRRRRASISLPVGVGKWQITHSVLPSPPPRGEGCGGESEGGPHRRPTSPSRGDHPASASRSGAAHNRRTSCRRPGASAGASARLDRRGDVVALPFGHHRHVQQAGAEGLDPGGDAAGQRRRPRDQLGADVVEAGEADRAG